MLGFPVLWSMICMWTVGETEVVLIIVVPPPIRLLKRNHYCVGAKSTINIMHTLKYLLMAAHRTDLCQINYLH